MTEGASVTEGQTIAVLQSMKMEIEVQAESGGTVSRILVKPGDEVNIGQTVAVLE